jgi:hypothetical protein
MATRGGKSAPSILDKVTKPASTQQTAPIPVGGKAPITVTPIQGDKPGQPQQIEVPVVPAPGAPAQQQKK